MGERWVEERQMEIGRDDVKLFMAGQSTTDYNERNGLSWDRDARSWLHGVMVSVYRSNLRDVEVEVMHCAVRGHGLCGGILVAVRGDDFDGYG